METVVAEKKVPLGAQKEPFLVAGFLEPFLDFFYGTEDHLGSTRMVLDQNGTVKQALMYQAYGTVSDVQGINTAATDPLRQKFTTKEFDEDGEGNGAPGIDQYYFGARFLDPDLGIWGSRDPAEQLFNSYGYSTNPVITIDPDGEYIIGAIAGAIVGGYLGGVGSSGSFNPVDWGTDDWVFSGLGAISGALSGSNIENSLVQTRFDAGKIPSSAYGARALLQNNAAKFSVLGNLPDATNEAVDAHIMYGFSKESPNDVKDLWFERKSEYWMKQALKRKGYNPITTEYTTKADFLRAYHSDKTRFLMYTGHHNDIAAALGTSVKNVTIAPWELRAIGKGANLDRIIFKACMSNNIPFAEKWISAFGPGVKYIGWSSYTNSFQSVMFNTLGVFDGHPASMF